MLFLIRLFFDSQIFQCALFTPFKKNNTIRVPTCKIKIININIFYSCSQSYRLFCSQKVKANLKCSKSSSITIFDFSHRKYTFKVLRTMRILMQSKRVTFLSFGCEIYFFSKRN